MPFEKICEQISRIRIDAALKIRVVILPGLKSGETIRPEDVAYLSNAADRINELIGGLIPALQKNLQDCTQIISWFESLPEDFKRQRGEYEIMQGHHFSNLQKKTAELLELLKAEKSLLQTAIQGLGKNDISTAEIFFVKDIGLHHQILGKDIDVHTESMIAWQRALFKEVAKIKPRRLAA